MPDATPGTPPRHTPDDTTSMTRYTLAQWVGMGLGMLVFVILLFLPAPEGMAPAAWRAAAAGSLMAIWWMTEALPIAVTSLLPLVLFPLLGIASMGDTASPYANPIIFLFMGGFIIAQGMQRWNLHRRLALNVIVRVGTRPGSIILGFMLSAALLSMWVSNTATAVMMLPIGLSVVHLAHQQMGLKGGETSAFSVALMLGIAYGCSLGGIATIIGTPTNAILSGFMAETYGYEISFIGWMLLGLPITVVGLPIVFLLLTKVIFPLQIRDLPGGRAFIREALDAMGAPSRAERIVAAVFTFVAVLWITRPMLTGFLPGLTDTGIAMFGAVLLFLLPVDIRTGRFVLTWQEAAQLPWGVLLIFGGGLSLAAAINKTGLAAWIGSALAGIGTWPIVAIVLAVTLVVVMLTELTSNVATASAFLPILASVALGIGENPLLLALPTAIGASCAFMLPVATPPNAIVYGSGVLTIPQMARAGFWLNLLFVALITVATLLLAPIVFDLNLGVVPGWAGS